MSYISLSDKDKKEMLNEIGIKSIDELFRCIPDEIRLKRELDVPDAHTESELLDYFKSIGENNTYTDCLSFLGAGAYNHFIPSVVDYLSMRGEFLSPYTPYQPEVSQGTLQIIFEFQTLICQLTGMDIANASLYDGASGTAEAVLMANRVTRKPKVLVARSVHPQYRQVVDSLTQNLDLTIEEIGYMATGHIDKEELKGKMDAETAAVVIQSPNFFGVIEHDREITEIAHSQKALMIYTVAEAVSMGILESPGALGVDIVTGEAQSLGMPLSFGGPYLGFMACAKDYVRQFPGRIVGQTQDVDGKNGFVLTLSTREQHIRRERATSNICTNQAWCALRATIFMETLGREGMRELAIQNMQKADYARAELSRIEGVESSFSGPVFNEFVLAFDKPWPKIAALLEKDKILGGLLLEDYYSNGKDNVLFNVTEIHSKNDIDVLTASIKRAVQET